MTQQVGSSRMVVMTERAYGWLLVRVPLVLFLVAPQPAIGQDPESILRAAKLDDRASLWAVDRIRDSRVAVQAARRLLMSGATGDVLWAATYVYANAGGDPAPLRSLLTNPSVTVRVMAGAGLLARGEVAGFDPLVEALADNHIMAGAAPPQPVWLASATILVRSTAISNLGPPFDADHRRRILARDRWRTWLAQHRNRLRFNHATGEWTLP